MSESLATMVTDVGSFITEALGWATNVLAEVTSDPILFLFVVCVPLVGLGIGLVKRLINV